MEANLSIRFECADKENRDIMVEYLSSEGRPIFEEDALPEYIEFFNKIEDIEYPDSLEPVGKTAVHAYFFLGGDFDEEAGDILDALLSADIKKLVAYIEADEYIEFYIQKNGSLSVYGDWNEERVDQAREDSDEGFKYLDEISKSI